MVTKIIIFIIILTSSAFANCKNYSNISNDEIKNLQIEIYKEKKFIKHVSKFYLALKKGEILTNYNKKKNMLQELLLIIIMVITVIMKLN